MSQNVIKRKIVIVGDGACGKTSLLYVFTLGEFPTEYHPTVFENYATDCRVDGKPVRLALWDTAGQEEYERLRPLSYSKAHIILIGFALNAPDSLDNAGMKWAQEVKTYCPNAPLILVGLKKDLRPEDDGTDEYYDQKYVRKEKAEQVARLIGARKYVECSSLTGEAVDDVFEIATRASLLLKETSASGCSLPTVYALSTYPARSAIAVVRITGPSSVSIYRALTARQQPKPRIATLAKLYHPKTKVILDEAIFLYFKGPNSYTGEDMLELHLHGGTAVIKCIMESLELLHTPANPIRPAEPGDFSKKAFQNGKMDLTQAEGINSLIHAETERQRVLSLTSMKGETKELFHHWREQILNTYALITTLIDFGEEHDIEEIGQLFERAESDIKTLETEVRRYLERVQRSETLMDGFKITLSGPPNAGKSSLLNIIANEDRAIVSEIEGTTRDSIEVPLDINGYKVVIGDTAGIRNAENQIEQEGIRRAKMKTSEADLNLVLLPCTPRELRKEMKDHIRSCDKEKLLIILNKSDLVTPDQVGSLVAQLEQEFEPKEIKVISCRNKDGIHDLLNTITQKLDHWTQDEPIFVSSRVQNIIQHDLLFGFEEFYMHSKSNDVVLAAEALKISMEGIGKITGEAIGVEEILGSIFANFCIGK
ncbi:hypothetical protein KL938_003437 [Ogataea parapolymorpha]|nr:hypothetical protein KL938_003437 [Ogataea parapolymorpha]